MLERVTKDEESFDESTEVDLARLPAKDRDAIMARVTPDDSTPSDAFALAQNEIRREMMDRGIQPKGFYNDDAARLQEEFNKEHAAERENRMYQKIQAAARNYLRETVHRRKMEHEREIREELEEIAKNPQAEVWLSLIQQNNTPIHATLRLSSIVCRALSKKLLFNNSLRSLNLSRNGLNDMAGKHLAAMLRRNTTLERLELEGNSLGPSTARELGDALSQNESLLYLNLESNPLTDEEKDFSGIAALGDMLGKNSTLRTLILWRTRLGGEGAKYLAAGLEKNDSIICLDIGNNRIGTAAAVKMDTKLVQNRMKFEKEQEKKVAVRKAQLLAAEKDQKRRDEQKKKEEHNQWIEDRKQERAIEREKQEKERQRKLQEEENRLRQIAERKAAEFAAKMELEKKKKTGKKNGKKKK